GRPEGRMVGRNRRCRPPLALLPEHRSAPATLAEQVVRHLLTDKRDGVLLQPGQRLAAGAGFPPGWPRVEDLCLTLAVGPAGSFSEEVAQPEPANVQGRAEAELLARPDHRERWGVTADVHRVQRAGHRAGPFNESVPVAPGSLPNSTPSGNSPGFSG